jgi:RNA polymerase sigma factor (sigma-70 family)
VAHARSLPVCAAGGKWFCAVLSPLSSGAKSSRIPEKSDFLHFFERNGILITNLSIESMTRACDDEKNLLTRQTLLNRLQDGNDHESWKEFFDTYWQLIYQTGTRAGLSTAEAQDAAQDTLVAVFKQLPGFKYDPVAGSFKNWLLTITRCRIADQFRKRRNNTSLDKAVPDQTNGTTVGERIPDPSANLDAVWDQEWRDNLTHAAIERVKRKVDPAHFQIFDLYVLKRWPIAKVKESLGIGAARIYLIKHRVSAMVKKEAQKLETYAG